MSAVYTEEAPPVRYRRRRQVSSCDFHKVCPSICRSSIEARILGCKWAGCTFFFQDDGLSQTEGSNKSQMWDNAPQMLWHTSQVEHVVANLNRSHNICAVLDVPFEIQVRIEKWVHEKNRVESRYGAYRWSVVNVEKEQRSVVSTEGSSKASEQISVIIARSTRQKDGAAGVTTSDADDERAEYAITASGREGDDKLGKLAAHSWERSITNTQLDAGFASDEGEATEFPPPTRRTVNSIPEASRPTSDTNTPANASGDSDEIDLVEPGVDSPAFVTQAAPPPVLPEIRPLPQLDPTRILEVTTRRYMDASPPRTLVDQTGSRMERPRRDLRRYSYPYPSPTLDPPQLVASDGVSALQQYQQQIVDFSNNSHVLASATPADAVSTSSYPAQNQYLSLRIPCFWSSDIRISLSRALSVTSSSPLSCLCWNVSTRCDTFVLLYILAALISLISSIVYTTITHDTSGGFTVGAYMVALASLVIMPLQSRHLRRCECASSSSQVVAERTDEFTVMSLNGMGNAGGGIRHDPYMEQSMGVFEMRPPATAIGQGGLGLDRRR